jgi:hypothetical protein
MRQDDKQRWVSDDGHWLWSGSTWEPMSVPPDDSPKGSASPTTSTPGTKPEPSGLTNPDAAHPLSPDGTQIWDGAKWAAHLASPLGSDASDAAPATTVAPVAPTVEMPPSPPVEHPISTDGHWRWDGNAWQPIESPSPEESGTRQLSADGRWVWDGKAWLPTGDEAAKSPAPTELDPGVKSLIAAGMPVSTDGHWVWNGQAWQPTNQ